MFPIVASDSPTDCGMLLDFKSKKIQREAGSRRKARPIPSSEIPGIGNMAS